MYTQVFVKNPVPIPVQSPPLFSTCYPSCLSRCMLSKCIAASELLLMRWLPTQGAQPPMRSLPLQRLGGMLHHASNTHSRSHAQHSSKCTGFPPSVNGLKLKIHSHLINQFLPFRPNRHIRFERICATRPTLRLCTPERLGILRCDSSEHFPAVFPQRLKARTCALSLQK